jgi:glycosyltransferase involved in cell wall biosynthesis
MPARNEAGYIDVALQSLISEGIEVVLLDNGSVDGTRERAERFLGNGLLRIADVPWRGYVDFVELLRAIEEVLQSSFHDWHIRVDADEWLRATKNVTLVDFLEREVARQHWVVNFREFVFVPPVGVDMWGEDYRVLATQYYVFEPTRRRLMRAWRRGSVTGIIESAGHQFQNLPAEAVYPEDQTLRHYIGLSWSHAIGKRADRTYAAGDLARGWHANRLDLRFARPIESSPYLKSAEPWDARVLDDSTPTRFHFWQPGFHETVG